MTNEQWPAEKFYWLLFFGMLGPWMYFTVHMAANSDILWLCTALDRILHGGTTAADAYEVNPPLSLLTCLPPYLLQKIGVFLPNAITAYALFSVALSAIVIRSILQPWAIFSRRQLATMVAGFIIGETILGSNTYIGERDHLIALSYVPLVLIQLALTYGLPWPKKTGWAAMVVGGFLILIKPHYGVLPILLLLHRAVSQRRLSVIFDPDFIALAGTTIVSVLATWLFFPDWVTNIFPDALKLYTTIRNPDILLETGGLACGLVLLAALLFAALPRGTGRQVAIALVLSAIACLIPFYVQGRGYHYHLFPAFGFFGLGIGLLACVTLERESKKGVAPFFATLLLCAAAYAAAPPDTHYPTNQEYAGFPLTRLVADCDGRGAPCPFFMFNDSMGILQETAFYANASYASRFPSFWFLPRLIDVRPGGLDAAERERYFTRFTAMVTEDFVRYRPRLVLIGRFDVWGRPFDFVQYFSRDPAFSAVFGHYRLVRRIVLDRSVYTRGTELEDQKTTPFDVYIRKD